MCRTRSAVGPRLRGARRSARPGAGSSLNTRTNVTSHTTDTATTFRAGIIGEVGAGLSPFFSYTESFQPIAGQTTAGTPFRPQTGRQFETGVKWQADRATLVTLTGFDITERNRPIPDPANPLGQIQAGELTTKGFELEATRTLPAITTCRSPMASTMSTATRARSAICRATPPPPGDEDHPGRLGDAAAGRGRALSGAAGVGQ